MLAAALLRAKIKATLADRIPSALSPTPRIMREVVLTGIRPVDELLHGGFPAGAITEIVGAECSGRTSLALSFIAGVIRAGNVCAWVDVSDTLHPESAAAACGAPLDNSSNIAGKLPDQFWVLSACLRRDLSVSSSFI